MAELRGVPPGRAGRLWLQSRLVAAQRAADLLERKLRVLRAEQAHLAEVSRDTARQWRESWAAADRWAARTALLGGWRELRLATPAAPAQVSVAWRQLMGTRCPDSAPCQLAEPGAGERGPGTAAGVQAGAALRAAVRAAADDAVAQTALRVVNAEVTATRRRLRAITDRRVPALTATLQARLRELDENERMETVRLRWAAARQERDAAGRRAASAEEAQRRR
jgi:V/A-type H+-transporting ATPase subunit D